MMRLQKCLLLTSLVSVLALLPFALVSAEETTFAETAPSVTVETIETIPETLVQTEETVVTEESQVAEVEPTVEEASTSTEEETVTSAEEAVESTEEESTSTEEEMTSSEAVTSTEESIPTTTVVNEIPFPKETPNEKVNNPSKVIDILPELVGSWEGHRGDSPKMTITFRPDGSGTVTIEAYQGWKSSTVEFKINQLEQVGDNLYRYVGGKNWNVIGFGGLGGWGVKYDWGFVLKDNQFQPVAWQTLIADEFDYSQVLYQEAYTRVPDEKPAAPASPVVPLATSPQQESAVPTLPKTGEVVSILLPVIGLGLLAGIAFFVLKNRKK